MVAALVTTAQVIIALLSFIVIWLAERFEVKLCITVGAILIITVIGIISPPPPAIPTILDKEITYKSIDVEEREYYALDEEGNIYEITQEQWAELDVPVISK